MQCKFTVGLLYSTDAEGMCALSGVVGCDSKFFFSSTVRVHSVHSPAGVYVAR